MLGKLLKYDFRSMWKQFAILWPGALAIGIVNRFTIPWVQGENGNGGMMAVTAVMLLVAVLVAMGVAALVFVIQRFYKGLLGDEGYLMHTLPVRTWQLIASKLICAIVVSIVSGIVAMLSLILMMPIDWGSFFSGGILGEMIHWITQNLGDAMEVTGTALEVFLMIICMLAVMMLTLYLAMAVGHLFQRHRVLMSVIAFIAIDILINNLLSILARAYPESLVMSLHGAVWSAILVEVVLGTLMFLGTELILRKRLNLE